MTQLKKTGIVSREVKHMTNKKLLTGLFPFIILGLISAFSGTVAAQHEGGLGIKKIPLNIANEDQLLRIEGMTEELAEAIVDYRETKGFFKSPQDLLKVPGMTKEVFEQLNPQVGSEGDIYCIPKEGSEDDEEPMLSPSKC
jgi:competence ComEA-like helix-hairpin-helix protein